MNPQELILVIDDDLEFCQTVSGILKSIGYQAVMKTNPVEALDWLKISSADLVLLDIKMPLMAGTDVLTEIVRNWPEIPVIMITGQSYTVPVALEVAKKGSYSFLSKPIDLIQLKESVKKALESKRPKLVNTGIDDVLKAIGFVSASQKIQEIMMMASKVAKTNVPVLITGESGVGKEMLARSIFMLSDRSDKSFIQVDCGTLTETLLESELFGHMRGSFTGSIADKKGLFEEAEGGTIFLDEIDNTSITFQQKLLLVLNSGKTRRVGDTKEREVDVRIISATNKILSDLIGRGEFREDLFYRLNRFDIHVPPLRERAEDIPPIARHLLSKACVEHNLIPHYFSPAALDLLSKQPWHGNVRELDSVVTKLAIFTEIEEIEHHTVAHALKAVTQTQDGYIRDLRALGEQVEEFEKRLIVQALKENSGNQTKAAQALGVERTNFVKKMRKHNIREEDYS